MSTSMRTLTSKTISLRSVGTVVPLTAEAKALTTRTARPERMTPLPNGAGLWLSGMGPVAARNAAEALADAGATALAVFGVAGALQAGLRSGTLICPVRIFDDQGCDYTADIPWRTRLVQRLTAAGLSAPAIGPLLSVAQPLLTASAKTAAGGLHAVAAVDMESAAVAAVAQARGLPFLALRVIVDELDDTIPATLHACIDAWGSPRPLKLIASLSRHPSLLTALPGLYSRMTRATRALRAVAQAATPTLGWDL